MRKFRPFTLIKNLAVPRMDTLWKKDSGGLYEDIFANKRWIWFDFQKPDKNNEISTQFRLLAARKCPYRFTFIRK